MANAKWNEIDSQEIVTEEYYCAFIDILGYKDKAEQFFSGKFNLEGRFERALNNAISIMRMSSKMVDSKGVEIKFFSDSIIFLLPKLKGSEDRLFSFVNFCAILSAHLSFEDLFVRGGISHGAHREKENENGSSFLASIALQKAYILESTRAKNPRILIDDELVNQLGSSKKILIAKEGEEHFVHFAPQIISREGGNCDEVFYEMTDINEARERASIPSVKEKYTWILDYYYWTLSETPNVDISRFKIFDPSVKRDFKIPL